MMLNLLAISEVCSAENAICSADSKHRNKECVQNKINISDDFSVYLVLQLTFEQVTCFPN